MAEQIVLSVQNLGVGFKTESGFLPVLRGVNIDVKAGEIVALVGESGCGKTMTALSIMGLLPPGAYVSGGRIEFLGIDLLSLTDEERRKIRGKEISMIFQEPSTSLNPVLKVGEQIEEVLVFHYNATKELARRRALQMLKMVEIPSPQRVFDMYPHQLSGGMKQRVMIAQALAAGPKLLIADEPTTALDVTVQAQILSLLKRLQRNLKLSVLLITHNLGIVAELAQRIYVMYAGRIVEEAPVEEIYTSPAHPYTQGLLASIPTVKGKKELKYIPGTVPSVKELAQISGCPFFNRCPKADSVCSKVFPPPHQVSPGHRVWCFHPEVRGASGKKSEEVFSG